MKNQAKKILIVAAHPDDEVLGAGATMARWAAEGSEIFTLLLGDGETARQDINTQSARTKAVVDRQDSARKANRVLGVKDVFIYEFPDNRFDSVPLLEVVQVVEKIKSQIKPDVVLTHYEKDLNVDHRVTCQAVLTATRPMVGETVKEIYSFEVLSSTEWNFPVNFSADMFVDVTPYIEKKLKALQYYKNEMRPFPHPRSMTGVKIHAQDWGMKVGVRFAEAFKTLRCIR